MRILHVADLMPGLHERVGGAEFVAQRMISEQAQAGVEIHLATLPAQNHISDAPWQRHFEFGNLDRYAHRLAYAVKQMYLPWDPVAARGLRRIIEQSNPDIIHYHNLHFSGLSVLRVARDASIPSVKSIYDYWLFCPSNMLRTSDGELCQRGHGKHCVDCVGSKRLRLLKPLKSMGFAQRPKIFSSLTATVDRFVVLSNASRDMLIHHGISARCIHVIPQYIWTEAAESTALRTPIPGRLLYVGWIEDRKGLLVLVDAFQRLADDFPELHIEVLGLPSNQTAYLESVHKRISESGLESRVHFRGRISRDELLGELKKAYLVMVPEQWENMSPVILTEAMAAGACTIASRVGGIKHFVEDRVSGLLADRDDGAGWAELIRFAMNNPEQVAAMAIAAQKRARSVFDPESINQALSSMYHSMRTE